MKDALGTTFVLLLVIVLICVMVYGGVNSVNNWNRITEAYERPIGKHILVDKDTLTIVAGNDWLGTFTLSNGIKVDSSFIKTRVIK